MEKILEVCCGSYYDAKQAYMAGVKRIELNSALYLGGLTPSTGTLKLVKKDTNLQVITMVRPRGAGFCYLEEEYSAMKEDVNCLMENGADGIAFGILTKEKEIDKEKVKELTDYIHSYHGSAVFHRAFDCTPDPYQAIETLIALKVDRVLTSGQKEKAFQGIDLIADLQEKYGKHIEILPGSGVYAQNVNEILRRTKVTQVHSSCKHWLEDVTTAGNEVDYGYCKEQGNNFYDVVSKESVKMMLDIMANE